MSHYTFYKIVCEDCPEYIYIGSTKAFRKRKSDHKNSCENERGKSYNYNLYKKIRMNGGWDNWSMIIIDEANDLTFLQARIKEEDLRVKYSGNLNSQKAYISEEGIKERYREYTEKNKEKMKEKDKKYRENNKEKIKEYREKNKDDMQKYRDNNREKIKEKDKKYYENNKEKINEKNREKIICECGCVTSKGSLSRHLRSDKHKKLMEQVKDL